MALTFDAVLTFVVALTFVVTLTFVVDLNFVVALTFVVAFVSRRSSKRPRPYSQPQYAILLSQLLPDKSSKDH